jgi:hypothetical protein
VSTELVETHVTGDHLIGPVMDLESARQRLVQFQQFIKEYLVEGEDYGTIPGTPKPTLLKPGSDKLCELYGLADDYQVVQRTEDFTTGLFDYEIKCIITSKRGGFLVSTGLGSCNSYEKKYRWRDQQRKCPNCGKESIIKGRDEYGGGWLCFAKKGGCGAKFTDGDKGIEGQSIGKVQNEDVADLKNTILKMAKKRAKIDATLSATRSSGVFTQDVEDWDIPKSETPKPEPVAQPKPVAPVQAAQEKPAEPKPPTQAKPDVQPPVKPTLFEDVLLCEVKEIFERKTKDEKGTSYLMLELRVPFNGHERLFNFHGSLFDCLKTAKGQICRFVVAPGTKGTLSIEDVKIIGDTHYMKGQPEDGADKVAREIIEGKNPDSEPEVPVEWKMYAAKGKNLIGVGWQDGVLRCMFAPSKEGGKPTFYLYDEVTAEDANKLVKSPYPDKLLVQLREKHKYKGQAEAA